MDGYLVRTADEIRAARAHAGAALCHAAIAEVVARRRAEWDAAAVPLNQSEQILQRAQLRAEQERRAARRSAVEGWSGDEEEAAA